MKNYLTIPPTRAILPFIIQSTVWRTLVRPFFNLFVSFEVTGLENLKDVSGSVIFAPNHAHSLDPVIIPLALPLWSRFSPMYYVARERAFYNHEAFGIGRYFYGGWVFQMLGAFPLVVGVKDYAVSLARHLNILNTGGSLTIFPEGKFTKTGTIGKSRGGVGYLAHTSGRPVVPVFIQGTFKLTFADFLSGHWRVSVHFGEPLYAGELFGSRTNVLLNDYQHAAELVMQRVRILEARYRAPRRIPVFAFE